MLIQRFETADQLRAYFNLSGITGRRTVPADCPIARYLRRQYPHAVKVEVGPLDIDVIFPALNSRKIPMGWGYVSRKVRNITQPGFTEAMAQFVSRFDAGMYPELIDREAEAADVAAYTEEC